MKKALILFVMASAVSFAASASIEEKNIPGDPGKKDQQQNASFGLASGYFSLFSFLSPSTEPADTTYKPAIAPVVKQGANKK